MKQLLAILLAPLGLALVGGLTALVNQSRPGPVYSVAEVQVHLTHDFSAWVGRTVLVRGILSGCPHRVCPGHEPYLPPILLPSLVDATPAETSDPLQAAWAESDSAWTFLRHVPLLSALVPAPQVLRWDMVAAYQVQIRTLPAGSCPSLPCYEAVILDAAPDAQEEG